MKLQQAHKVDSQISLKQTLKVSTMANPTAPPQPNAVSQASQGVSTGVFTERFDASQLSVGPAEAENTQFNNTEIFSPLADCGESPSALPMPPIDGAVPVATAATADTGPPVSAVRVCSSTAKFRYSNRKLLATPELYLQPTFRGLFTERTEIVGQIKACTRVANGNRYHIEWKRTGVVPLPVSLNPSWLCEWFPKEKEDELKKAIGRYDEVYPYAQHPIINVDGQQVAGTPPTMARGRSASAFRTASTIALHSVSTLSRSTRSRSQVTQDEFDNMNDSDVEDGDDVDTSAGDPLRIPRDYDNISSDDEEDYTVTTESETDDASYSSLYDSDKDNDEVVVQTVDSDNLGEWRSI